MKKEHQWLLAIFLVTLTIRLTLALIIPNFTYESYFHLRHVEYITHHGLPLYNDPLSYGGRQLIFLPFFHYLVAFFNLFLPLELLAKIIPNLLIATLTLIVYLIGKKITNDDTASLLSAFVAGFLPILFTPNAFTPETLALPLLFLVIYAFLNYSEKKYLYFYVLLFMIISLTSRTTILILIGYGFYLLLSFLENKKINKAEIEIILFSFFFFLWSQFIFFKEVLLKEGIGFIWQNIPPQIITQYYPKVSIISSLLLVSLIPFLAGIYVVYRSLFQLKNRNAFLIISLTISIILLALLQLIEFKQALAFFGVTLAILFALFYHDLINYFQDTKFFLYRKYFLSGIILLLFFTMTLPALTTALNQPTPTPEVAKSFQWLKENIPPDSGVLSLLEEGHLVTYYGQRKNIMDDQFALIKNINNRFTSLKSLFTTQFQTQAIGTLNEYDIQYLVLTPHAKNKYNITTFNYLTKECFEQVYNEGTRIYLLKCKMEQK